LKLDANMAKKNKAVHLDSLVIKFS
jgi:hypothetical protein